MNPSVIAGISGALVSLAVVVLVGLWVRARRRKDAQDIRIQPPVEVIAPPAQRSGHELDLTERRPELAHLARVSMMGELSGAIANELKQPLTAILSNAQAAQRMLSADVLDPREVYDILGDIISDDKRAVVVIERMRALLTTKNSETCTIYIPELAQEVLALAHSTLVACKVTVSARHSPGIPCVSADPVQIQEVLLNLILNASEAMVSAKEEQRHLTVATTLANDGSVLVTVSDTGAGIPVGALEKLFDPFYTTKISGLGLGLSCSKAIVDAHGGRIWAVNNPSVGATFCFTLPPAKGGENGGPNTPHAIAALLLLILGCVQVAGAQSGWSFLRDSPVTAFTEEDIAMMENALQAALESPGAAPQRWTNPKTKSSGELRVLRTFTSEQGRNCKRLQIDNQARGKKGSTRQTLCRDTDGQWLVDPGAKPKSAAPPPDARQLTGFACGTRPSGGVTQFAPDYLAKQYLDTNATAATVSSFIGNPS